MVGVAYDLGGPSLAQEVVTAGTTGDGFSTLGAGQLLESTESGVMSVVMARIAERGEQIREQESVQRDKLGLHRLGGAMLMGFPGPRGAEIEASESY